jgi:acetyl-CoA C-acetyltransferase/3-oxo-5,6-didehydrosuberyl-CoA/3-oxoadipyl-CoA thiolase
VPCTHNGESKVFAQDEHPRPQTTLEGLMALNPSFKPDGRVTAGNASGIVDGAATVLLASEASVKRLNLKPRARIVDQVIVGSEPVIMLTGPIPATRKVLQRTGLKIDDIDLIEINEAFAVVPLCVMQELGIDPEKVNVNGGAIALGHPLGATGAMLIGTLVDELERGNKRYGMATMCIGIGMGITTIIERL